MEQKLILQNPWWKNKFAIEEDEKVRTALSKKKIFKHNIDIHDNIVLLGPRQTGKTTFLKLTIRDMIKKGIDPKNLVYFSCEPLNNKDDLITLFETIDQIVVGKTYIFLDEITSVSEWEKGIKYFLETDLSKDKKIIVTGSNAASIKHGVEQLPGRNIKKQLFLPLSFKEFINAFYKKFDIEINKIDIESMYKISLDLMPYLNDLNKFLKIYLSTGGYLRPIYEFIEKGYISEETYEIYTQWILGDISKLNKKEKIFRSVISGIIRMYSSSYSLNALAKEMEIPTHSTLSEYLDAIEDIMLINNLYFFDINKRTIIPRKQRKTYFTDPFLYSVLNGYINGKYCDYSTDVQDKLIEGVVLEHLARIDKFKNYNGFLGYYQSKKEIDFVLCKDKKIGIEVKWQNKVDFNDMYKILDENILLSKTTIKKDKNSLIIPTSIFLMII